MTRFIRSLKLKKKGSEVLVESLENLRTQMLSVSNNDILNLEPTKTETYLLTPKAHRQRLRLQSLSDVPTKALENRLTQMLIVLFVTLLSIYFN